MSRTKNDNARRQVGIYALYDWCGGSDAQWLMVGADEEYHSHDHGHYFPGGPEWTINSLQTAGVSAHAIGTPAAGLDATEVGRIADRLEAATDEEVIGCMSNLPSDWPVSDVDLDALLDFVCARRGAVAQRLRALAV